MERQPDLQEDTHDIPEPDDIGAPENACNVGEQAALETMPLEVSGSRLGERRLSRPPYARKKTVRLSDMIGIEAFEQMTEARQRARRESATMARPRLSPQARAFLTRRYR